MKERTAVALYVFRIAPLFSVDARPITNAKCGHDGAWPSRRPTACAHSAHMMRHNSLLTLHGLRRPGRWLTCTQESGYYEYRRNFQGPDAEGRRCVRLPEDVRRWPGNFRCIGRNYTCHVPEHAPCAWGRATGRQMEQVKLVVSLVERWDG